MKNMLKNFLLVSLCFLFIGCGSESVDLDLEKIDEELVSLTGDGLDITMISSNVEQYFEGSEFIYDFDFDSNFGLNKDNISEYSVMANFETKNMYLALKPIEGKKEEIKNEMNSYFDNLISSEEDETVKSKIENRKETEIDDLLIYIVSEDNDKVYEAISNSKFQIFGALEKINDSTLEQVFSVKPEDVEEYLIAIPAIGIRSNSYVVVKPKSGKKDDVKASLDNYMTNLEAQMEFYLADQYDLIKNRLEKEYGGYLIYVISNDNDKVYNTIIK